MKKYTVSIYLTVTAESEERARKIAYSLEIRPRYRGNEDRVFWNPQAIEVEEQAVFK